ncbi:MAG: hypothetical protein IPL09_00875 [Bacteroidetes bacterium]|nr:hypothetical protein [Bacteroidota bacterium]MBK8328039.1 hypothetical protein [Bacteroidota bacterium]MBK9299511.1 hypothetical protein [Bacteroidota bacterium]
MNKKFHFFLLSVMLLITCKVFSQASWEPFGQNRVQYRTFNWKYYDSTHFRTFYYDKGNAHALYALNVAEQELSHIVYMMGGRLNKKLNIIIYNSFSEYKQTNIGRKNEALNLANGGKIDVVGDNIPVYFNGDHNQLKKQITKGIASVIKDNMLFGDNIKDAVKNAVKMNLPDWYTLGYVAYIADDWSAEKSAELKSLMLTTKNNKITDIGINYPLITGHSFWNYISKKYGENYISNLLYLTRYRKSVNNALEMVLKKPYKEIINDWTNFYKNTDSTTVPAIENAKIVTSIKTKSNATYGQIAISPQGRDIAYVEKLDGEFKVFVRDIKYNKTTEIIAGGIKASIELADPDYPLLSWSPSGRKMAILYQKKNQINLRIFTAGKSKMENRVISSNKIDRITGMCFMSDENTLAVTAIKKGQSDLYKLTIRNNRFEPITNDLFDDKQPVFVQNGIFTGILFLSNRTSPYIGEDAKSDHFTPHFNMYLYDPSKGNNLVTLSESNTALKHPMQWGLDEYAYLTEENGKQIRQIVSIEKRQTLPDTISTHPFLPLPNTLVKQEYIHQTATVIEVFKNGNEFIVQSTPFDNLKQAQQKYSESPEYQSIESKTAEEKPNTELVKYQTPFDEDTNSVSFLENIFLSRKNNANSYQLFEGSQAIIKPKIYQTTFYTDFLQSSLDNTLLFTRYQPFDYTGGAYQNPPISGFITSTLTDVMEDYKIRVGARLGIDLRGLDYFFQFNNYRKRTDWGMLYFHHATTNQYDLRNNQPPFYSPFPVSGRVGLDYLQSNVNYPLDMLKSIRLNLGIRYDRIRVQAKDKYSIEVPDDKQFWVVSRAEYVYDNTITPLLNIWKGTRAKIYAEYQYKFNAQTKGFYNLGYDARNYLTIYKNVILASRLAGAFSGGNAKVLYLMGGVDNDLNPKSDENTSIDYSQNYAFQSLTTNMRGYRQGFRNGNSYMLLNEEIRFPIANTLFKRPVKSGFLRNLQLVAFTDIGSAWRGLLPNAENIKMNNVVTSPNSPVTVFINDATNDFGWGYGFGLRTKFLGYFIRTDCAWNIDGGKKPILHISLATDF